MKIFNNPGAIILAAGHGSRIKSIGEKPLLKYKTRSFIEIAVDNITSFNIHPVLILTNSLFYKNIKSLKIPGEILLNKNPEEGMLSSILIGISELPLDCSGFLLYPIDFPLITKDIINKLFSAHQLNPQHIIRPIFNGASGHPVIFPKFLFSKFDNIPKNQGARYLTNKYLEQTTKIPVNSNSILLNINTPELYNRHCQ